MGKVPKRVRFRISLDLTFFAAALKASLWLISGFPALIRWISSLQIKSSNKKSIKVYSNRHDKAQRFELTIMN